MGGGSTLVTMAIVWWQQVTNSNTWVSAYLQCSRVTMAHRKRECGGSGVWVWDVGGGGGGGREGREREEGRVGGVWPRMREGGWGSDGTERGTFRLCQHYRTSNNVCVKQC